LDADGDLIVSEESGAQEQKDGKERFHA
jgi:hypothetical protein